MVDVAPSRGSSDEDPEHSSDEEKIEEFRKRSRKKKGKGSFWRELPILLVVAVGLAFLIQTFLARVYMIPSESMEQTLHGCTSPCFGDRVLVDKLTYDFTDPTPGDVVVFHGPDTWINNDFAPAEPANPVVGFFQGLGSLIGIPTASKEDFVKRIIAVGGQTVKCCDEKNRFLVDGKPLDEPYVYWEPGRGSFQDSYDELEIPDGYLFVMGDNRNDSCDSRCQGDRRLGGLVPVDKVVGKARVVVLPPGRWGGVSDQNPQVVALGAPVWQDAVPAGVGLAAAWPVLLLGRRVRGRIRRSRLG
ncbi:signal peptidase I [Actinosynnema sp. NPDC047251]|uniref:Signal peptidase I n=1 Tax=Saccharothrix espanaensis (strain ATCC 51144 / DSM 44229 / JCM 9112 / NBRC 15066 / NRRL 15764) TaxID=1179773 RepID=K0K7I2_SACES|nr:signal peptidase I [Saccharothrix espanaensis]CCH34331.1 Signal peptidase I [Saccharothrix espanaensis DSM 44229]